MRIAVMGYGSIARRHIDIIAAMIGRESLDLLVCRERELPLRPEHAWARVTADFDDVVRFAPGMAVIASPATRHVEQALKLAGLGVHMLIEKPLSADLSGADDLIRSCEKNGAAALTAYNMNYLEPLNRVIDMITSGGIGEVISISAEVGQYLPLWRPEADYRSVVSANSSLGGGVLLELSHEIEYADRMLGGARSVSCVCSKSGILDMDAEDRADILLEGARGSTAAIHMNMLQKVVTRSCRAVGTEGVLTLDFIKNKIFVRSTDDAEPRLCFQSEEGEGNKAYVEQMRHFFSCARGESVPLVPLSRGARVVELVMAAKESSSKGMRIPV
ncbi:MAG: Gfo/Idh/MocA family oxidoreductase [Synergistaceae bacterium]|jgi:predicted dehydrogenase|nr:Gfo/Idh/MocA family oxidoreductase [Synergistaceae bacterium]